MRAQERGDVEQPVLPQPAEPVQEQQRRAVAAGVDDVDAAAEHHSERVIAGQSTVVQVESSPSAYVGSGPERTNALAGSARTCPRNPDTPLPYQRPCASRSTSTRRCTPTGTSSPTVAQRRFGIDLPYETQSRGRSTGCEPEQLKACVEETHRAEHVLAAEPYPGAVETIRAWHERGPLHPHHLPPRRRRPPAHERVAGPDRPAPRRAVLLRRQARPLPGDRDRGADRRLAGQPAARASRRGSPPRRSRTRGTETCDEDVIMCAGLAERSRHALQPRARMTDRPAALPAPPDHRAHLPAIEPERQVTDWGRSERVECPMDKTLYEFLYHYWFRVEVEGIEHVPATGGALLVSNHSGALPPDAAMIAKAIKTEHPRPAPAAPHGRAFLQGLSGPQHAGLQDRRRPRPPGQRAPPARTTRSSSCSSSPRAARAPRSSTRTATSCAASAAAASWSPRCAPGRRSSPSPSSAPRRRCRSSPTSSPLKRLTGLIYFPITPTFPQLGLLGGARVPAGQVQIRFLEPIPTDQWGDEPWDDKGLVQTVADEVRAPDPGGAVRDARRPPLGLARMRPASSSPGCPATGAAGSPRRSRRDAGIEAIIGVCPRTRRCRSSAPSSSASAPSTRCCAGSCTRPRSTR